MEEMRDIIVIEDNNNESVIDSEMQYYIDMAKTTTIQSSKMMDVIEFVDYTKYDINKMFVNHHWSMMTSMSKGTLIELNSEMLQHLDFSKTANLIQKLETLYPGCPEERARLGGYFGDHVNVHIELEQHTRNPKKRIFMTGPAYKELLLDTNTPAAKQAKKYLVHLEVLFARYMMYQRAFQIVYDSRKQELLQLQNNQLMIQNEELLSKVSKQTQILEHVVHQNDIQQQKLDTMAQLLHRESSQKVIAPSNEKKKQQLVVLQSRSDEKVFQIIRGQNAHVQRMKKQKMDEMDEVATIESDMNPLTLYVRFAEHIKGDERFRVAYNRVILQGDTNLSDLIIELEALEEQKYDVSRAVQRTL
jgi:Protein of unknown function (DUF3627)